jgi:N-acetylglutamate synthase-like GNAT family acetyltransferase
MTQRRSKATISLRSADGDDAATIHALITANLEEGHLLPRTLGELTVHATRFVVAVVRRKIVNCFELAPLSPASRKCARSRSIGVRGSRAIRCRRRAAATRAARRFEALRLTHAPGFSPG